MFKTILAPVDLNDSDAASPALDRAVELAALSGGNVRLIYIRSIMPVTYMEFVPPSFDEEQQREAEEELAKVAAGLDLPAERISSVVRLGSIYHEVLDEADKCAADLIVVGSHRPSMATYLLGSNATTIVRHARISVLVVR
ncbi:MAG: universal stress protein [Salinarimonadaceae bacterium]|nr:MAG: universal stress protein [Salinarimonadaceae bacterium]